MIHYKKVLPAVLGILFVVGLPPVVSLVLTHVTPLPTAASDLATAKPLPAKQALVQLAERRSTLEAVFATWQERYVKRGGDHDVVVSLGWARGMSEALSPARGAAHLDLYDGTLTARLEHMGEHPLDLWLLDNQDGPGRTAMPEKGDHLVRVGRFYPTHGSAELHASLGADFFRRFELDWLVVTRAGRSPVDGALLFGTRSMFERTYTRARLATSRASEEPRGGLALLSPHALLSLFTPVDAEADSTSVLVAHGLVSSQVGTGADLFFRGTFQGNGRTCNSCHQVAKNQEIDPDFIATLPSTDPLFIAEVPASQGGVPGLEIPDLLRQFALILENRDGAEDPTNKFVMRGVPHSLSMSTSIVAPTDDGREGTERTGWGGDATTTGGLRLFPMGATQQHFTKTLNRVAGVDFVFPTDTELDAMDAFMRAAGRENDLDLSAVSLSDAGAENGRLVFLTDGKCNNCHGNAGAISPSGGNRNFNTGVEQVEHPARAVVNFPHDGGFGLTPAVDTDGDGVPDTFGDGTFNVPPLIEAADTGPFFHNNVKSTLEEAVAFYSGPEFNSSPAAGFVGGISLTPQESDDVAAFLRVVNAAFNISISIQRNSAAASLENSSSTCGGGGGVLLSAASVSSDSFQCTESVGGGTTGTRQTVNALLALSNIEATDAVNDLSQRGLNSDAVTLLTHAISLNSQAINETSSKTRKSLILSAQSDFASAKSALGQGLDFILGEGNLLF